MRLIVWLLSLMLIVSGCGKSPPRFDTSSQTTFEASGKKIRLLLNPSDQKLLDEAFRNWVFAGLNKNNPDSEKLAWDAIKQKVTGKTAKQVITDYQDFLNKDVKRKVSFVLENQDKIKVGSSEKQVVDLLGNPDESLIDESNGKKQLLYKTAIDAKDHPAVGDVLFIIKNDKVIFGGKIETVTR